VLAAIDPAAGVTLLAALVMGVVEGLTEFLPVSSTGHLILTNALLGLPNDTVLEIGIQAGAISAILVLYWPRLLAALRALRPRSGPVGGGPVSSGTAGGTNLIVLLVIAALPAGVLGAALGHRVKEHLFTPGFVAATTAIGGALLLLLERVYAARAQQGRQQDQPLETLRPMQAFGIGLWQCLALLPGTSRSAATIAGGMLTGLSRATAAEFSFLVGLPILYGACAKEVKDSWSKIALQPMPFVVGTVVAFLTALVVVRPFVLFLRKHTFAPFAYYRLVLGAVVALAIWRGWFGSTG
jgi:undecaprenyl-diphosphatase